MLDNPSFLTVEPFKIDREVRPIKIYYLFIY